MHVVKPSTDLWLDVTYRLLDDMHYVYSNGNTVTPINADISHVDLYSWTPGLLETICTMRPGRTALDVAVVLFEQRRTDDSLRGCLTDLHACIPVDDASMRPQTLNLKPVAHHCGAKRKSTRNE